MSALEDRLRTELRAESELIAPESIPALSLPEQDGRRAATPRRWGLRWWPAWVTPMAAAAAVLAVIIASLAISGVILRRPAGNGPAGSSGVFAKVPRYFIALPRDPRPRDRRRDRHRSCAGDHRAAQAIHGVYVGGSRR